MTRALDRLADRLMAALPTSRAGTIAMTSIGGGLLLAASIHWLGWWITGGIVLVGCGWALWWLAQFPGKWRPW